MVRLESIIIGERVRKDMGNLQELAASIERHGLLHPIVLKPDNTLIAGHRRIEAVKLLGWTEIQATYIEVADLLSAERDENAQRKDFTPSEAVAIGKLIEEQEKPDADARRRASQFGGGQMPEPGHVGSVRDIAANAVGMGGRTYDRAKAVVAAAETEPAQFGDLPSLMDESKNVLGTFKEMERRRGKAPTKKAPLNKTGKNLERIEKVQFRAGIWQQVKDSLINLTSLPDASEVAHIVRSHARDKSFVDKKLPSAIHWLQEFSHAWRNSA